MKEASITVRLVTGDHINTAINHARMANIISEELEINETNSYVMEGEIFS